MRLRNIFLIVFIFSFFIFFTKKYFFTLSITSLGFIFLLIPKGIFRKNLKLYDLKITIGLFFIFAGLSYTSLNIIDKLKRTVFAKEDQNNSFVTKYFDTNQNLITKTHESGENIKLGYRFKKNSKYRVIKQNNSSQDKIAFDVNYSINNFRNRKTFSNNIKSEESILFLGDSTTFGVGLNDYETLPSHFARLTSQESINGALMGYGSHQVLMILENDEIFKEKSENKKVSKIIYRLLPNHINRAAGYVTWDEYGPCYEVDKSSKEIIYKGSLNKCLKKRSNFKRRIAEVLFYLADNEPITYRIGKNLLQYNYQNEIYNQKDYERFIKIISRTNLLAQRRGTELIIILQDLNRSFGNKKPCQINKFARSLGEDIKKQGINLFYSSDIHSLEKCDSGVYDIAFDGHPTSENNFELAKKLSDFINNLN